MLGWTNAPADLSDRAALDRLHAFLPDEAALISSDLVRATATADALERGRFRLPHEPLLREMNFGDWEGRHHAEVEREDPDRIYSFWDQPGDVAPPNGESWNALSSRICEWVDRQSSSSSVVAVAHMGVILTQLQRALGISAQAVFSYKIDNLSVTHLAYDGEWHARSINHLP
jgi:broad specificity phosphatase PhoE